MRVLWFTNTASCYGLKSGITGYNGGGWISSLEKELRQIDKLQLGICFFGNTKFQSQDKNVTYYSIKKIQRRQDILRYFPFFGNHFEEKSWAYYEKEFVEVIEDFRPDIIEFFGSEQQFGLVASLTNIPSVLHIQGILNPYINSFLPPFMSWHNYHFQSLKPQDILRFLKRRSQWACDAMREREILHRVINYIGRTAWDERVTKILSPGCKYFHGDEILREEFYRPSVREVSEKLLVTTTISNQFYKGFDLVLKTAAIMTETMNLEFEWRVYGNIDPRPYQKRFGIKHEKVNIRLMGVASSDELRNSILHSTVYVHPSYIDNSPNSLCEAQILGCTPIATDVGGVSSLIDNGVTGYLIPANDPYQLAALIYQLFNDIELNYTIGCQAKKAAMERHDKQRIVSELLKVYQILIGNNTKA